MSLWKWNNVELEIDFEDAEFAKKYEDAFRLMEKKEKELQKAGTLSGIISDYCMMFYQLFDGIFGDGTGEKLFSGKKNVRICEECYDSFISECKKQVELVNKRRDAMLNRYKPNRAQRRAAGRRNESVL